MVFLKVVLLLFRFCHMVLTTRQTDKALTMLQRAAPCFSSASTGDTVTVDRVIEPLLNGTSWLWLARHVLNARNLR